MTTPSFDKYLLFSVVSLILLGLLIMTSASMVISERQFAHPFYYLIRQASFIGIGLIAALITLKIKVAFWEKMSGFLLLVGFGLLLLVLIPGLGREVNGSTRWLGIGGWTLQVSEFVKLAVICYLSSYLVRHQEAVQTQFSGFLKPMILLGLISGLLLLEPDFGAIVVIMLASLCLIYLAGAKLWQFSLLFLIVLVGLGIFAIASPYRILRLTTFLDPWSRQFDSGYQLTQSLIAFGRGGIEGVGLGSSIQKLFYLPEAHTDFLFAVLGEELGLIGMLTVLGLYLLLLVRGMLIGRRALLRQQPVAGYLAYGISLLFGLQAFVNIGVSTGLLPTKGLTLPLVSYGGSSLLISFVAIALLFRIDYETHSPPEEGCPRRGRGG